MSKANKLNIRINGNRVSVTCDQLPYAYNVEKGEDDKFYIYNSKGGYDNRGLSHCGQDICAAIQNAKRLMKQDINERKGLNHLIKSYKN